MSLDQDDFQAIVKNMSETNMKFQGLTVQAVRALYDHLDELDGSLAELITQDYNVTYVLQQCVQNMKSSRAQLRADLVELATTTFSYSKTPDVFVRELDTQLRQSKNSQQKIAILQLTQRTCELFDQKQMQLIHDAATAVSAADQNGEVRAQAAAVVQTLDQTAPRRAQTQQMPQTAGSVRQSQVSGSQRQRPGTTGALGGSGAPAVSGFLGSAAAARK